MTVLLKWKVFLRISTNNHSTSHVLIGMREDVEESIASISKEEYLIVRNISVIFLRLQYRKEILNMT